MIRIVTDSSCDIPEHLAEVFEIEVIPLLITFGKEVFREGVDITPNEFYQRLVREAPRLPKTSIPSVGEVAEVYQEILDDGDEIISIHLSALLSGMHNVAVQAAKLVDPRGRYITVIDSRTVSMCLGWTAIKAAEMAIQHEPKEEIIDYIHQILPRLRIPSFLDTLEFIKYGGRIGSAAAFFGTALDLKPLLQLKEGKVSPLARVRTRGRAMDRLLQLASQMGPFDDLAVMHTHAPDLAQKLARKLGKHGIHPYKNILIAETGVAMGTHTGPNSIGLCAVVK